LVRFPFSSRSYNHEHVFEFVSEITNIETIAAGRIDPREKKIKKSLWSGPMEETEGNCFHPTI